MSDFVLDRKEIEKQVLFLLHEKSDNLFDDTSLWWKNKRSGGGLALTLFGNCAFERSDLEKWSKVIENKNISEQKLSLMLDHKLPCPYFFYRKGKENILEIWDSRIASLLFLHEDIGEFLKSFEDRKKFISSSRR